MEITFLVLYFGIPSSVLLDCNTSEFLGYEMRLLILLLAKFCERRYMATHLPQSSFPGLKREYFVL